MQSAPLYPPPAPTGAPVPPAPPQRWRALRIISTIFRVLSFVVLSLGILAILGTLLIGILAIATISQYSYGGSSFALVGLIYLVLYLIFEVIYTGLGFLYFYAIAEVIQLLIQSEDSSRMAAWNTQIILGQLARMAPGGGPGYMPPPPPPFFGPPTFPPSIPPSAPPAQRPTQPGQPPTPQA